MDKYKVINGTSYHKETSEEIVNILEHCRQNEIRVILDYGDTTTGKSWGEKHDTTGKISRSIGVVKIPILVYNSRSLGGGAILDDCIIGIKTSKGKKVLYQHPNG